MSYESRKSNLLHKYPAISDLAAKAKKRIPPVAWAYLETGTSNEDLIQRNLDKLKEITLTPKFLKGELDPKVETELFGKTYAAPIGIAPVGLTGLMWPRAEMLLADSARNYNIPYCLSTVATETPETLSAHIGDIGWFQLYPPREKKLRQTILNRARDAGFTALLITADIPTPSRRERTKRAGMTINSKITPRFLWEGITHPSWSIGSLRNGLPRLRTVEEYPEFMNMISVGKFVKEQAKFNLSWDYCKEVRDEWDGPIIIKGLMHPSDALEAVSIGMDGIVVSNHGARQFDGAPSSIEALPKIVAAVKGKTKIIFDSGIRNGLDILRAMSLGADFTLAGRAFVYGVSALGQYGGHHAAEILIGDLKNNMSQMGIESLSELVEQ